MCIPAFSFIYKTFILFEEKTLESVRISSQKNKVTVQAAKEKIDSNEVPLPGGSTSSEPAQKSNEKMSSISRAVPDESHVMSVYGTNKPTTIFSPSS